MERDFSFNRYPLKEKKQRFLRLRYPLILIALVAVAFFFFPNNKGETGISKKYAPAKNQIPPLTKKDLVCISQDVIKNRNLTINWDLQQFIADMAARYKLYYGSIVVMDAHTGNILALYGQTPSGQDCSKALDAEIAGSIFKLVTATAAIEQAGFTGDSMFYYTGSAYTLYKRQLVDRRDKWCVDISLADAFARSNNVVFGKLGTIYVGKSPICLTAEKMGFGKSPLSQCEPSTYVSPRDEYNLAELACGFNKETRMSPIHAAQMVTAVLNNGYMIKPQLILKWPADVERVPVMNQTTAQNLYDMMELTVKKGTVAKSFRGISSDRVLKHLYIGAKSGSIDGAQPEGKRDWFVGYARNPNTGEEISVACVLVLKDRFWIRANMFSRLVIRHYFSDRMELAQSAHTVCGQGTAAN